MKVLESTTLAGLSMIIEDIPKKQLELQKSFRKNIVKYAKLIVLSITLHYVGTFMFAYIEQCYEPQIKELTPVEKKYNEICETLKSHLQINATSHSNSSSEVLINMTKTLCQEVEIETLKCDIFTIESMTRWASYQGSIAYTIGLYTTVDSR